MDHFMQRLLDYLAALQPGAIADTDSLANILEACWNQFSGYSEQGMLGYKLYRMEDAVWRPPILSFAIERHGATVMGSTRAELHNWEIDVEHKSATCSGGKYRQLYSREPGLNVHPIAEEVAQLIIDRRPDERLKWNEDGSVRVQIGKILPAGLTSKQTLQGRRKRLRVAIEALVDKMGWRKIRANYYAPPNGSREN